MTKPILCQNHAHFCSTSTSLTSLQNYLTISFKCNKVLSYTTFSQKTDLNQPYMRAASCQGSRQGSSTPKNISRPFQRHPVPREYYPKAQGEDAVGKQEQAVSLEALHRTGVLGKLISSSDILLVKLVIV